MLRGQDKPKVLRFRTQFLTVQIGIEVANQCKSRARGVNGPWLDQGATAKWCWETSETHHFAGSLVRQSSWYPGIPYPCPLKKLHSVFMCHLSSNTFISFPKSHQDVSCRAKFDFGVLPRPILHGLPSGPGSGQEAADAIKALAPRQVRSCGCGRLWAAVGRWLGSWVAG